MLPGPLPLFLGGGGEGGGVGIGVPKYWQIHFDWGEIPAGSLEKKGKKAPLKKEFSNTYAN